MNSQDIERVVRTVLSTLNTVGAMAPAKQAMPAQTVASGVFQKLDDAVSEAFAAQKALGTVAMRERVVAAIRKAGEEHAQELAEMAVAETGMGRVEDKVIKKASQARMTPGPECLTPRVITGDKGLTLIENAPWGVIASVTPSTNPGATAINNAISMISAGNAVVFAPHPAAKKTTQRAISILNEAIVAAGGPNNLLTTVADPNIETAQQLFRYPGIGLLVVTGGDAVVHAARTHTDKRLIAAGAGNPPAVVDETADIPRAARDIVFGASFDNNIICADEKEIICVSSVCDLLMGEMQKNKAVQLNKDQVKKLIPILLKDLGPDNKGTVSRDFVGRDAAKLAAAINFNVPSDTRLLFFEAEPDHPFAVTEMMMPIVPVIRAANADEAIDLGIQLESGCHHTAAMHSKNLDNLSRMATEVNTSIFVKNGPCIAGLGFGGEGWTTMTISTPTGEGVTNASSFVRLRRCVMVDHFRIV